MSPTWTLDVPIGTIATFIVLLIVIWLTSHTEDLRLKFIITGLLFGLSMFTVAAELFVAFKTPFWISWLTIGIGELLSMSIGGLIMYAVSKKFNLSK
jgi:Predicted membrane protein